MNSFGFTRRRFASLLTAGLLAVSLAFSTLTAVHAQGVALCAAPESALSSAYVTVNSDQAQVNVRGGPNSYLYDKVGLLLTFESAPALGRSPGGDWIQIACPGAPSNAGWVYAANVTLTAAGELPVVAIPVTSTPLVTPTVDPELAAQFPPILPTPTRLPTFTPAALQPLPAFTDVPALPVSGNLSGGLIIAIAGFGLAILILSYFLRR